MGQCNFSSFMASKIIWSLQIWYPVTDFVFLSLAQSINKAFTDAGKWAHKAVSDCSCFYICTIDELFGEYNWQGRQVKKYIEQRANTMDHVWCSLHLPRNIFWLISCNAVPLSVPSIHVWWTSAFFQTSGYFLNMTHYGGTFLKSVKTFDGYLQV